MAAELHHHVRITDWKQEGAMSGGGVTKGKPFLLRSLSRIGTQHSCLYLRAGTYPVALPPAKLSASPPQTKNQRLVTEGGGKKDIGMRIDQALSQISVSKTRNWGTEVQRSEGIYTQPQSKLAAELGFSPDC